MGPRGHHAWGDLLLGSRACIGRFPVYPLEFFIKLKINRSQHHETKTKVMNDNHSFVSGADEVYLMALLLGYDLQLIEWK